MSYDMDLAQAIGARLCHDLAGSIGTVNNCIGLIDSNNKTISTKAKTLVEQETARLVNRIKFFRSMYGTSEGEKEMSLVFMTKLIKDFFADSAVKINLNITKGFIFLEVDIAKALMCLIFVASEKINYAGQMLVSIEPKYDGSRGNIIKITAKAAKKLNIQDKASSIFDDLDKSCINVSNCREFYIENLCKINDYVVMVNKNGNIVEYELRN